MPLWILSRALLGAAGGQALGSKRSFEEGASNCVPEQSSGTRMLRSGRAESRRLLVQSSALHAAVDTLPSSARRCKDEYVSASLGASVIIRCRHYRFRSSVNIAPRRNDGVVARI